MAAPVILTRRIGACVAERALRTGPFDLMDDSGGRVRRRVQLQQSDKAELKRWSAPELRKLTSRDAKVGATNSGDGSLVS
jgi:hypothetical protein